MWQAKHKVAGSSPAWGMFQRARPSGWSNSLRAVLFSALILGDENPGCDVLASTRAKKTIHGTPCERRPLIGHNLTTGFRSRIMSDVEVKTWPTDYGQVLLRVREEPQHP